MKRGHKVLVQLMYISIPVIMLTIIVGLSLLIIFGGREKEVKGLEADTWSSLDYHVHEQVVDTYSPVPYDVTIDTDYFTTIVAPTDVFDYDEIELYPIIRAESAFDEIIDIEIYYSPNGTDWFADLAFYDTKMQIHRFKKPRAARFMKIDAKAKNTPLNVTAKISAYKTRPDCFDSCKQAHESCKAGCPAVVKYWDTVLTEEEVNAERKSNGF